MTRRPMDRIQERDQTTDRTQDDLGRALDHRLREERELERRDADGLRELRRNPAARREFSRDVGQIEHLDWEAEARRADLARGLQENKDFAIEYTLEHPDGGCVRYDYVNFREHRILDRKPGHQGEKVIDLARRYQRQRERHIEAYRARFGVEPTYEYAIYPSTRDLDKE